MWFRLLSTDERHNSEDSWESMSRSLSRSLLFSPTSFPTNRKRTEENDESRLVERCSSCSFSSPPDADGAEERTTIEWCSSRIIRADLLLVRGATAALTVWPTILRWQCRRSTCLFSLSPSRRSGRTIVSLIRPPTGSALLAAETGNADHSSESLVSVSRASVEKVWNHGTFRRRLLSSMVMSCRHRGTNPFQ